MSETIKQAVDRCRGNIYVFLHEDYIAEGEPLRLKVSKPEAKKLVIDKAPSANQPRAKWEGSDLLLMPSCTNPA